MISNYSVCFHQVLINTLSILLPIVIPLIHFGAVSRIWDDYNYEVDKYNCRNNCWDTIFKGKFIKQNE